MQNFEDVVAGQCGPNIFDLRAILQKRDNSPDISHKMIYNTTDSQDLKLKKESRWVQSVCHWNYHTIAISNLIQISISAMTVVEAFLTLSFLYQYQHVSGRKSETIVPCFVCHSISLFRCD